MKRRTIQTAMEVAKRFIEVARVLERQNNIKERNAAAGPLKQSEKNLLVEESLGYTRESAQLKRVSMDLTHILADLRLNR